MDFTQYQLLSKTYIIESNPIYTNYYGFFNFYNIYSIFDRIAKKGH